MGDNICLLRVVGGFLWENFVWRLRTIFLGGTFVWALGVCVCVCVCVTVIA
jgi:hypothetical protein